MRDTLPAVAVVALLVLAGCSGAGAPTDATAQTTNAPTTNTSTTATADTNHPPGVAADGVANVTALVDAHRASVVERGATMESTTETNGTVDDRVISVSGVETARLSPGATRLRWTVRANTTLGNETRRLDERYYANESTLVSRVERNGNVTVRARNRSDFWNRAVVGSAAKGRIVNATLSNANYTVADVSERDGRTVTTLVSEDGTYSGRQPIVEYDATVTVASSGRVLSLHRTWRTETERSTNRYTDRLAWSAATPVERPHWADNATAVSPGGQ